MLISWRRSVETLQQFITYRPARLAGLGPADAPAVARRIEQRIFAEPPLSELDDAGEQQVVVEVGRQLLEHVTFGPRDAVGDDWPTVDVDDPLAGNVVELPSGIREVLADVDLITREVRDREPAGGLDQGVGLVFR